MPHALAQFVGRGASLLAMGRANRKASIEAGGDAGPREGVGSATRASWPAPLVSERERRPTETEGWFEVPPLPSKAALRA